MASHGQQWPALAGVDCGIGLGIDFGVDCGVGFGIDFGVDCGIGFGIDFGVFSGGGFGAQSLVSADKKSIVPKVDDMRCKMEPN